MGEYNAYASIEDQLKAHNLSKEEIEAFKVSDEEVEEILSNKIYKLVFGKVEPLENGEATMSIIGGQPGSGKSRLIELAKKEFENKNGVTISMDEYRVFHPRMDQILKTLKKHPNIFNLITLDFAYKIEEAVLNKAIEENYNIAYEVSLNSPDDIIKTINKAKQKKYHVNLKAMAVHKITSLLGAQKRYEEQVKRAKKERPSLKLMAVEKIDKLFGSMNKKNGKGNLTNQEIEKNKEQEESIITVPRSVNEGYHEQSYNKMLTTVIDIQSYVDNTEVYKRGETKPELVYSTKDEKEKIEKDENDSNKTRNTIKSNRIFHSAVEAILATREEDEEKNFEKNKEEFKTLFKSMKLRRAKPKEYELMKALAKYYEEKDKGLMID